MSVSYALIEEYLEFTNSVEIILYDDTGKDYRELTVVIERWEETDEYPPLTMNVEIRTVTGWCDRFRDESFHPADIDEAIKIIKDQYGYNLTSGILQKGEY